MEEWLIWRDLRAVCLKSRHCVPLNIPTTFCGLTDESLALPQAVVFWRWFVDFALVADLRMWGAMGKTTLMHSLGEIARKSIAKFHNNLCCFSLLTEGRGDIRSGGLE